MVSKNICLMICKNFEREAEAVLKTEGFDNVKVNPYPAAKFHLRMEWDEITKKIQTLQDDCEIMLLGGACVVGLDSNPQELKNCSFFDLNKCFDMFINKPILESFIKQGAYLVSPSWLKSWRKHMKEYEFDKKKAQDFFKNSTTKLLLLDTGVYENLSHDLQEFAEFVDLPYDIIPVGLDFFTLYLKKLLLEWQLKEAKINTTNQSIGNLISSFNIDIKPSILEEEKGDVTLFFMEWDDKKGPYLQKHFPTEILSHDLVEKIGFQLFHSVESIYGQQAIKGGQGVLLNIENYQKEGYVFFDSIDDQTARGRQRPFMVGVLAPKINYFESLRIKEIFKAIAQKISEGSAWDMTNHWEKVSRVLSTPLI